MSRLKQTVKTGLASEFSLHKSWNNKENSIFQLHAMSNFSARNDEASKTMFSGGFFFLFFFFFPFSLVKKTSWVQKHYGKYSLFNLCSSFSWITRKCKKQPKKEKQIKRTQVWLQNKNEIQNFSASFSFWIFSPMKR